MTITVDVDLEKFRYSLVGDGYLLSEALKMSDEQLISMIQNRVVNSINREYAKGKRLGLY